MTVSQPSEKELLLSFSKRLSKKAISKISEFAGYLEKSPEAPALQDIADQLADEVNQNWWNTHSDKSTK